MAEHPPRIIESITCPCGITATAPIAPGVTLASVWNRRATTDPLLRDAAGIIASTLRMFQRAKIDSSAEKAILDRITKELWEAS
jgi:hypothetical protein